MTSIERRAISAPFIATAATYLVGMTQPRLDPIKPGVRIGKKPPTGWTNIIIKSIPRVSSGEMGSLPASGFKTATLFRNVIVANVKPIDSEEKEFELAQIGVGICVPNPQDQDQDVVVTADRADALGLNLSTVERLVLDAIEAEVAEGRIIARTPTFALFRWPVTVLAANKHHRVHLYYAFCVDAATGRLRVGIWTMRMGAELQQPPRTIYLLASNPIFDCELDVRAKRILGTLPYNWSFAMRYLPPGRPVRVSPALGELIVSTVRRPAENDPANLERMLMQALSTVADAKKVAADRAGVPKTDQAVRSTAIPPPYRTSQ
jgi:hypothetical protein